jgi:hypothetical protein
MYKLNKLLFEQLSRILNMNHYFVRCNRIDIGYIELFGLMHCNDNYYNLKDMQSTKMPMNQLIFNNLVHSISSLHIHHMLDIQLDNFCKHLQQSINIQLGTQYNNYQKIDIVSKVMNI